MLVPDGVKGGAWRETRQSVLYILQVKETSWETLTYAMGERASILTSLIFREHQY